MSERQLDALRDRLLARQAQLVARCEARDEPAAVRALRETGREQFAAQGLPHSRMEEWRYTSLAGLARTDFSLPDPEAARGAAGQAITREQLEELCFPVFACGLEVFVDGHHAPALSTPDGLARDLPFAPLAQRLAKGLPAGLGAVADAKIHPFVALNTAFLEDGAVIDLPRGADVRPLHLVFLTSGDEPHLSQPRVLIRAEAGSRATVIQDFVSLPGTLGEGGSAGHLRNTVAEVVVEEDAELRLVTLQRGHSTSTLVSHVAARVARDGRFASHVVTLGGRLVRNDLEVALQGEGAEGRLDGLFLCGEGDLVDNHTLVDHAVPHTTSHELYKGVLDRDARGVFRGRVIVRPDAQKIVASQSNPNLLLAGGAEIDTKPQLEIHADDVRCSHGSAIGRLDPDALFYLRTRGLGEPAARRLLVEGFAAEVLARLPDPALADALKTELRQWLARAHAAGEAAQEARHG